MIVEIKIPSPGESITEVEIAQWLVANGEHVEKDQEIAEIESEKATLTLIATESGKIDIKKAAGTTVAVGDIACTIDSEKKGEAPKQEISEEVKTIKEEIVEEEVGKHYYKQLNATPLAKSMLKENKISADAISHKKRKITKYDVAEYLSKKSEIVDKLKSVVAKDEERVKMSSLRKKLSERLVAVKNETAMLTTFNEVDMTNIVELRNLHKDAFYATHNIKLGFMSFFTKASSLALQQFPNVNASIDNDEIIFHHYNDISFAVQTEKGLMVPVLRNVELMTMADIEINIFKLAEKARNKKISIEELTGGTFTISNGGVFGSMLSTPIINPPQSAILGMHNIVERPVAIKGKVEIRPIMYLAVSYDHRIIDGRDSVGFLVKVKEYLENPLEMLMNNNAKAELMLK